ncbi:MAG: alpha/beta fold hydrolase [Bacteroidota bacterium]
MSRLNAAFLLSLVPVLAGCLTIPLEEDGVFQAERTVTPGDFDVPGLTLEVLSIPVADGVTLDAWWMRHDDPRATVLYFGGQGFLLVKARATLEALAAQRMNVLAFDYRGYGRSDGTPSVEALKDDARVVYDTLVARPGVDPGRLIAHGHSMGSFVATALATERPVPALVLENPATDVEGLTSALIPLLLRPFVRFDIAEPLRGESNVERLRALPGVALLVAGGENDVITPPALARDLHDEAATDRKTLVIASGRGHNDITASEDFAEAFDAFLDRHVAPPAP